MNDTTGSAMSGVGLARNIVGLVATLALVLWAGFGKDSAASDASAPSGGVDTPAVNSPAPEQPGAGPTPNTAPGCSTNAPLAGDGSCTAPDSLER